MKYILEVGLCFNSMIIVEWSSEWKKSKMEAANGIGTHNLGEVGAFHIGDQCVFRRLTSRS